MEPFYQNSAYSQPSYQPQPQMTYYAPQTQNNNSGKSVGLLGIAAIFVVGVFGLIYLSDLYNINSLKDLFIKRDKAF